MWPELPIHTSNKGFGQDHDEDDGDDDSYKVLGERYFLLFAVLAKSFVWVNSLVPKFQKLAPTLIIAHIDDFLYLHIIGGSLCCSSQHHFNRETGTTMYLLLP